MASKELSSGHVKWPTHLDEIDGAGMFVYAFWLADYTLQREVGLGTLLSGITVAGTDPFITCTGPDEVIALPRPGGAYGRFADEVYPERGAPPYVAPGSPDHAGRHRYLAFQHDAGAPLLGAACLGTTTRTYAHRDPAGEVGEFWAASAGDLTRPGRKLLRRLGSLYGRPARLVTYVAAG